MASVDPSPTLPAPAYPLAKPGFGKRSAPGQLPQAAADFAHLPVREAYLATYLDRLPDGAAMDVKTLAKSQPLYGQQAVRSALRHLSEAGHLRRVGSPAGHGRPQHVTRTYFSRTARDEEWWTDFLEGGRSEPPQQQPPSDEGPEQEPQASPGPEVPARPVARTRAAGRHSAAYEALADLGRHDPRVVLSAADCAALEGLAARWLERGVTGMRFVHAMTAGLPVPLYSPAGLLRRRLADKLPPEPVREAPAGPARWRRECTLCGVPGTAEALRGGLCRTCREEPEVRQAEGPTREEVRHKTAELRALIRTPRGEPRKAAEAHVVGRHARGLRGAHTPKPAERNRA